MIDSVGQAISLHVRRTDYIENINHTTLELDYYKKALSMFNTNLPVIVFSDDVEWCKTQSLFCDDRFMISESENNYIDMTYSML